MRHFTVAIIGGGPGGYVSAIRLNQFGIDAVVFEEERLGGVCLNHGCIPTKSLVKVADLFAEVKESENFGIKIDNSHIEYLKVWERKNAIVERLVSGVEYLFKKRNIPIFKEKVFQIEKNDDYYQIISRNSNGEENSCSADYLILATGSLPQQLPFMQFDGKQILSSSKAAAK